MSLTIVLHNERLSRREDGEGVGAAKLGSVGWDILDLDPMLDSDVKFIEQFQSLPWHQ